LHENLVVPEGDILIHAGDISAIGEKEDFLTKKHYLKKDTASVV
jgi:hypothetical protein